MITTTGAFDPVQPPRPGAVLTGREPPRSRWPWPVQVLLSLVVLLVASFLPLALVLIPGVDEINDPGTPIAVVTASLVGIGLLGLLVALAGVALLVRLDGGRRLRDVGWRSDRRSLPLLALGMVISAVVIVVVAGPLTAAGMLRTEEASVAGDPVWVVVVMGLSSAFLVQAIPEELIFRGYLLGSLRLRPVPAVLVSGTAFAAIHLVSQGGQQGWVEHIVYLADPFGFGLAAGALSLLTRSLWVAVGIHGGLHATYLATTLLERVDPAFAIGNGPASWLLTGFAYAIVAAVAMWLLARRGTDVVGGSSNRPTITG